MSKITDDSIEAFCTGTSFPRGNMQVRVNPSCTALYQHSCTLTSHKGDWLLESQRHGESKPFHGTARVQDLKDLDNTIAHECAARHPNASIWHNGKLIIYPDGRRSA